MRIGVDLGARARIGVQSARIGFQSARIGVQACKCMESYRYTFRTVRMRLSIKIGIAVCISNIYLDQHRGSIGVLDDK